MNKESEIFLDAICLVMYDRSIEAKSLVYKLIELYDTYYQIVPTLKQPLVTLYRDTLQAITVDGVDLTQKSEIILMINKLSNSREIASNRKALLNLEELLSSKSVLSDTRLSRLRRKILGWIQWFESDRTTKSIFKDLSQYNLIVDDVKQDKLLANIREKAAKIASGFDLTRLEGGSSIVDFIDMTDKSSVAAAMKVREQSRQDDYIMKTGLTGLNKMMGTNGGFVRGEIVAFMAASHHYKSGILMDCARWLATVNEKPKDCSGIPTIVFISLENEIYENLDQWFKAAYVNMFKTYPVNLTSSEIVDYVTGEYYKRGYKLLVYREMGESFTLTDYKLLIEKLESEGHTIVASILDYITLMNFDSMDGANDAKKLQNLMHRLGAYNKHKLITTITGLQVKSVVEEMISMGKSYIAKELRVNNLADCQGLYRELDLAFWLVIETNNDGVPYLTIAWAKHRYNKKPPAEYQYRAFPFTKFGILDDVGSEDTSVRDIYAVTEEDVDNYDVLSGFAA